MYSNQVRVGHEKLKTKTRTFFYKGSVSDKDISVCELKYKGYLEETDEKCLRVDDA